MLAGHVYKPLHIGIQSYFIALRILEILQIGLVLTTYTAVVSCGDQALDSCAEKPS